MTPEREAKIKRVLNHRQNGLVVVMENVHDPHNISAVMRTCDAVGVQEIFVLTTAITRHKNLERTVPLVRQGGSPFTSMMIPKPAWMPCGSVVRRYMLPIWV